MNIYIGIPHEPSQETLNSIRIKLSRQLRKYYGEFPVSDVVFFINPDSLSIYVMENAKYSGYDREITEVIKSVVNEYFPSNEAEIALNYQKLNPTFNPREAVRKKSAVSKNSPVSDNKEQSNKSEEFDYDKLSENYHAEEPRYSFEQVILPETLKTQINEAVSTVLVEHKVFDEWGLRTIIPNALSALSFYGPPGTGKSMAAEAIAQKLGKKILRATYADIESKFHGEGPKMVKAIFRAAERDDAVLFLDESDSLLSKRLTNVTDGSAQAINSMRSQLLICLEQFKGIVIFATNLVVNYDKAFLSRLINIEFTKPNKAAR